MKPLQEENYIGMGEGDMSDEEAAALKKRLNTMKELSRKRLESHKRKMESLTNTDRGDDKLNNLLEGGAN
jgi:hypothetical protein